MAITAGDNLNSVPSAQKQTFATNYLDFTGSTDVTWAQQYLPDLMEKEAEVFGPRTISGFLSQVGAEEAMQADQVVWSEQGRLHLSYKGKFTDTTSFLVQQDMDGAIKTAAGISNGLTGVKHGIRVNDTVVVADATNGVVKCLVTAVSTDDITLAPYGGTAVTGTTADYASTILVYGSEYGKGKSYLEDDGSTVTDQRGANEPEFKSFTNKPIIINDYYEVSGSDTARIGWVEVASEGCLLYTSPSPRD